MHITNRVKAESNSSSLVLPRRILYIMQIVKKMLKRLLFVITVGILACSCGGNQGAKTTATAPPDASGAMRRVELPVIPAMIVDPVERADYMALHYWDKFDFSDTVDIYRPEFMEQFFADYINVLNYASTAAAEKSIRDLTNKAVADTTMQYCFMELFEKYLYDPNSPMRNEDFYIPYLETLIASDHVAEIDKVRPRSELAMARKNRVGSKALDFNYTMAGGRESSLYNTKADYLILFINNPGCPACKEYIDMLQNSRIVQEMLREGTLKILALYPDADLKEWLAYQPHMPASWINAYDRNTVIKSKELYDLKAIPTLYLLDKNKTVLLKDCASIEVLDNYLRMQ